MLDYSKFHVYGISTECTREAIKSYIQSEIDKRVKKLRNKEEEIDNLKYERDLVENNIVELIRDDLKLSGAINLFAFYDNELNLFETAAKYGNYTKNTAKKDYFKSKEEQKDCEQSFNFIDATIRHVFFKDNKKFKFANEVLNYDWATYYEFAYTINKKFIYVCIPVFANATLKNYKELLEGYKVKHLEKGIIDSIKTISKNLDYNIVADELEKWINE